MEEKLRIYVGGLGAKVLESDLKKTFTSSLLGSVESVEIIRSKCRSFAYLDFIPVSEKGLAKLFSTYNGCTWKGGKLKLEKAKEHYLFRLRREWAEDSELSINLDSKNLNLEENSDSLKKTKKDLDTEKPHLQLFFPKLRKIKPIPFKGTGKHKYSFQRVEVPLTPINFCDCEEHSAPHLSAKKVCNDHDTETGGINEEELSMVKAVLNKLLEGEKCSKVVSDEAGFNERIHSVDNLEVDGHEEDLVSDDEDGLVMNMVSCPSNRVALRMDKGEETMAEQGSFFRTNQEKKLTFDNKRKMPPSTDDAGVIKSSIGKAKNSRPRDDSNLQIAMKTPITETRTDSTKSSGYMTYSQKSAWKDLVNHKESSVFHISDVLADHNPEVDMKTRSCRNSLEEKDTLENMSSQDKVSDTPLDKPSLVEEIEDKKSARGSAWLQKSSWLQLVGNTYNSSFHLAQIIPSASLGNQESQQLGGNDVSGSGNKKKHKVSPEDKKYPAEDSKKSRGKDDSNISISVGLPNVDSLTNEQNRCSPNKERLSSDSKKSIEQEDETSYLVPGRNFPTVFNRVPVPDIAISDTCPFMKTSASMKEWAKMKASFRNSSRKNKANEARQANESFQ